MNKLLLAAAFTLFTVSAHAQSLSEKSGVNSALGVSPSTQDFVTKAAVGDMFEIESSKLAQERADAAGKTFAARMIKDHTETSDELKALVSSGKVKATLPGALDKSHQSKLDKLKGLNGAQFDRQYDDMQRSAHKDAVSMFDRYAKRGDNSDLKAFASKHLPHLQEHRQMAQDLKTRPAGLKQK
jgi:putative membrane protein